MAITLRFPVDSRVVLTGNPYMKSLGIFPGAFGTVVMSESIHQDGKEWVKVRWDHCNSDNPERLVEFENIAHARLPDLTDVEAVERWLTG